MGTRAGWRALSVRGPISGFRRHQRRPAQHVYTQRATSDDSLPHTNTLRRTLSPAHIKTKSQCDQTTLHLAPLITPVVSRPAATTLIVPTPSVSQQTILNEDKPLTSTFPCCTLPKHSQLQVRCRLNKVLQVL